MLFEFRQATRPTATPRVTSLFWQVRPPAWRELRPPVMVRMEAHSVGRSARQMGDGDAEEDGAAADGEPVLEAAEVGVRLETVDEASPEQRTLAFRHERRLAPELAVTAAAIVVTDKHRGALIRPMPLRAELRSMRQRSALDCTFPATAVLRSRHVLGRTVAQVGFAAAAEEVVLDDGMTGF